MTEVCAAAPDMLPWSHGAVFRVCVHPCSEPWHGVRATPPEGWRPVWPYPEHRLYKDSGPYDAVHQDLRERRLLEDHRGIEPWWSNDEDFGGEPAITYEEAR